MVGTGLFLKQGWQFKDQTFLMTSDALLPVTNRDFTVSIPKRDIWGYNIGCPGRLYGVFGIRMAYAPRMAQVLWFTMAVRGQVGDLPVCLMPWNFRPRRGFGHNVRGDRM